MTLICVVDRIEGRIAVLIADDGSVHEVPAHVFGREAREGAVFRVPVAAGAPVWARAQRDPAEEAKRRAAAQARLDALRRTDAGGDVAL